MTVWMLVVLAVVGVIAGVLNTAAAGGSLAPFIAMTLLGISPLVANATCLAATPASFLRSVMDVKDTPRQMVIPLIGAVMGTAVGVWLVSRLSTDVFRRAVPVLLLVSVVVLLLSPRVKQWIIARQREPWSARTVVGILTVGIGLTSVYAGAFGGGVGVLVLCVISVATSWPWDPTAKVKNIVCLFTSVVGSIAFAFTGLVHLTLFGVLFVSMALGNRIGAWVTDRVPAGVQRGLVAIVTSLSALHLAVS